MRSGENHLVVSQSRNTVAMQILIGEYIVCETTGGKPIDKVQIGGKAP
jgi:hypothetical protein